jgi:hypothetical protein
MFSFIRIPKAFLSYLLQNEMCSKDSHLLRTQVGSIVLPSDSCSFSFLLLFGLFFLPHNPKEQKSEYTNSSYTHNVYLGIKPRVLKYMYHFNTEIVILSR